MQWTEVRWSQVNTRASMHLSGRHLQNGLYFAELRMDFVLTICWSSILIETLKGDFIRLRLRSLTWYNLTQSAKCHRWSKLIHWRHPAMALLFYPIPMWIYITGFTHPLLNVNTWHAIWVSSNQHSNPGQWWNDWMRMHPCRSTKWGYSGLRRISCTE